MAKDYSSMMDLGIVHFMAYPVIRDDNPELTLESLKKIAVDDFFQLAEVRPSEHAEVTQGMKDIASNSKLGLGVGAQPLLLLNKLSLNRRLTRLSRANPNPIPNPKPTLHRALLLRRPPRSCRI